MLMLIGLFAAIVVLLTLAAFYKSDMDKKLEKFPQPISRYLLLGHAHLGTNVSQRITVQFTQ